MRSQVLCDCKGCGRLLYNSTMFVTAGLLTVALVANLLIRPVDEKYHLQA